MRTRAAGSATTMRLVASRPSTVVLMDIRMPELDGRVKAGGLVDGLDAVAGLGHHVDVLLLREQHAEARAHHRLVIGDEDANAHGWCLATGRRALRRNPRPLAVPALISPP